MLVPLSSNALAASPTEPQLSMRSYVGAMLAGAVLMLTLMGGTMALLYSRNALPPPQFSNNLCLDEKLRFMKDNPPRSANLLVVGSSVAWRHFNSRAAMEASPGLRPYNAGLCGQDIAQTAEVTQWLLARAPSIRRVILIASPLDFEDCSAEAISRWNIADVDAYVFGGRPAWRYYMRYFDPVAFLQNAQGLSRRRSEVQQFNALKIDEFGDGPVNPVESRGLLYGQITSFDQRCFTALSTMAGRMKSSGAKLTVVLNPVHPQWMATYDSNGRTMSRLHKAIAASTEAGTVRFLDKHRTVEARNFFDAIHLRWPATAKFTESIL